MFLRVLSSPECEQLGSKTTFKVMSLAEKWRDQFEEDLIMYVVSLFSIMSYVIYFSYPTSGLGYDSIIIFFNPLYRTVRFFVQFF